jgi:dolichol-phosphate mannosyltransferase
VSRFTLRSRPFWPSKILTVRFLKFGLVGASGTLVNLGALFLAQEYLFAAIHQVHVRLNASLALAICSATASNFLWNRTWTWMDREQHFGKSFLVQFGQYALTCWFSIGMQFIFTNVLSFYMPYLLANLSAIALASIVSFVANDRWTFGR